MDAVDNDNDDTDTANDDTDSELDDYTDRSPSEPESQV
jgi:hypothetical protein